MSISLVQVIWKDQSSQITITLKSAARRICFFWTLRTLFLAIVSGPIEAMSLRVNRRRIPEWA